MVYKIKSYLFIILITFANIVFPQTDENKDLTVLYDSTYQINIIPNLRPLVGVFKIFEIKNEKSYSSIYNLQFINSENNLLAFEIIDTIIGFSYWPDFDLVDVNFDGIKDVWTIIDRDVKAQPSYHFWIFNPKQNSFELNKMFSDSLVCYLDFRSADSTISSGCQGGCLGFCGSERIYKVIDNFLVLIESNESDEVEVNGEWKIKSTTRKLIDGKMKVVEEDYSDYP